MEEITPKPARNRKVRRLPRRERTAPPAHVVPVLDEMEKARTAIEELKNLSPEGFVFDEDEGVFVKVGQALMIWRKVDCVLVRVRERLEKLSFGKTTSSQVARSVAELEVAIESLLGIRVSPGEGPSIAVQIIEEMAKKKEKKAKKGGK